MLMILSLRQEQGLSLIELLVAVTILAIALVPMHRLFLFGLQFTEKSNKMTIAANLARDMAEEIRSKVFWEPEVGKRPTLSGGAIYFGYRNGTTAQPVGWDSGEGFSDGDKRLEEFNDVDDYNGWCRGLNCECAGLPVGLCHQGWPLETYDGDKYNGTGGYPDYQIFTRKVEVFNIFPAVTASIPTHKMFLRKGTAEEKKINFEFYDLREENFPNLTSHPEKGSARGKTRLKVIRVSVKYSGLLNQKGEAQDVNVVVMPLSTQ